MKHLLTRIVTVTAIVAMAVLAVLPSAAAAPANQTNRIAFVRISAKTKIMTMREDGKQLKTVKQAPASEPGLLVSADLSPDGKRMIYSQGFPYAKIWVAKSNGKQAKKIIDVPGQTAFSPRWSPDGKRIVFVLSDLGSFSSIVVAKANGKQRKHIAKGAPFRSSPSWSPDGKRIVFSIEDGGGGVLVKSVKSSGGGLKTLTKPGTGINWAGGWSPDGKRIVFARKAPMPRLPLSGSKPFFVAGGPSPSRSATGYWDVFTMKTNGKGLKRVSDDATVVGTVKYSSDGKRILASRQRPDDVDLYSIPAKGGKWKRLTKTYQTLNVFDYMLLAS